MLPSGPGDVAGSRRRRCDGRSFVRDPFEIGNRLSARDLIAEDEAIVRIDFTLIEAEDRPRVEAHGAHGVDRYPAFAIASVVFILIDEELPSERLKTRHEQDVEYRTIIIEYQGDFLARQVKRGPIVKGKDPPFDILSGDRIVGVSSHRSCDNACTRAALRGTE